MRSGTSFFNGTVYQKTFLRFWPIWAANLVIWLLALPLNGLLALQGQLRNGGSALQNFSEGVGTYGEELSVVFAVIFSLLAAMAVCSHLYSTRSANFMGALPIRREGLFVSHYLSGLTMLLAPNVLVFVLTLLVEAAGGAVEWVPLLFWLAALSGAEFFFYSFAVCLGMFTGHLLALPVFYGIFNVLALAVYFLLIAVMELFYYGFSPSSRVNEVSAWLTPVLRLGGALECDAVYGLSSVYNSTFQVLDYDVSGLTELGIYALAGLALAAAALLLYRRRHLETAGDVVAVRPMRPVFKYGVAICSGLFFGFLTSAILSVGEVGLMIAITLWGVAGYFVAQMLLDKSFRVFRRWKGAVPVVAVFAVLFLVVGFDLTGYETRIPDPARVASVEISGLSSAPSDDAAYLNLTVDGPAIIEKTVALHRAAVELRDQEYDRDSGDQRWNVILTYHMEDGSTMTRSYSVWGGESDAAREGTVSWAVSQILSDRDLIWRAYGFDEAETAGALESAYYNGYDIGDKKAESGAATETAAAGISEPEEEFVEAMFYGADAAALLEAVKADFADGTIGVRQPWESYRAVSGLSFTWTETVAGSSGGIETRTVSKVEIAVPDTAVRTIAALKELGAR